MKSFVTFWLFFFFVFNIVIQLESVRSWGGQRVKGQTVQLNVSDSVRPRTTFIGDGSSNRTWRDKYDVLLKIPKSYRFGKSGLLKELFPASKIPDEGLSTKRSVVRRKIVLYHNFFRTKVNPTASNMLLMSWHPLAAQQAQKYADKCIFLKHNDPKENAVPYLGNCGQNLFVSSAKTPWFFALKSWFLEYKNFTYGAPVRNFKAIGHYTQMVWATSHKVGCGVSRCKGGPWGQFYNYVCHYCPGGNYNTIMQYPYKAGKPCADCPNSCLSDTLCTNSCPVRDFYSNCNSLARVPGYCAKNTCNATCTCGNDKIHKNYPW